MAMAQAEMIAARLLDHGVRADFVPLTTSGDRWSGSLSELGGKGAFVKEVDRAILDGDADLAVHNLKDIPGDVPLPDGLAIGGYPARECVQDAVIARDGMELEHGLDSLPIDAVVGTSSVRRQAQIHRRWPHLDARPVRGNANTRLAKLDNGEYDALVLADVGLRRIGLTHRITLTLPVWQMLPAVGAGQLAICVRTDRHDLLTLAGRLNEPLSEATARAERTMLFTLGGHCNSPIAAYCRSVADGRLGLTAAVYTLDGTQCAEAELTADQDAPEELGEAVAEVLLGKGARDMIQASVENH